MTGPFAFNARLPESAYRQALASLSGRKSRITLWPLPEASGPAMNAPLLLTPDFQPEMGWAEFRQALYEAALMMRRQSLLRQIASLRRDRKATCSARAELRAVTHETMAQGDRR